MFHVVFVTYGFLEEIFNMNYILYTLNCLPFQKVLAKKKKQKLNFITEPSWFL